MRLRNAAQCRMLLTYRCFCILPGRRKNINDQDRDESGEQQFIGKPLQFGMRVRRMMGIVAFSRMGMSVENPLSRLQQMVMPVEIGIIAVQKKSTQYQDDQCNVRDVFRHKFVFVSR